MGGREETPCATPAPPALQVFRFEGGHGAEYVYDSVSERAARRAGDTLRAVRVLVRSESARGASSAPDWLPAGYEVKTVVEVACPACDARRVRYAKAVPRAVPAPATAAAAASPPLIVTYGGALYRPGDGVAVDAWMGRGKRSVVRLAIESEADEGGE